MSAKHAVELVLGIGWAAIWIYWLATALTSKRSRLANAAKPSTTTSWAHWCASALINPYNRLNGITHQPAGDSRSARIRMWGLPWSRSRVRRSLPAMQAG
jgi:hypothetical protein